MPRPILQSFIRGDELIVESHVLDEFGQPTRILVRRAPVSAALRAALDAQIDALDTEQDAVEAQARADIAAGKRLHEPPRADLIEKAARARRIETAIINTQPQEGPQS